MESLKQRIEEFISQNLEEGKFYLLEFQDKGSSQFAAFVESYSKEDYFNLDLAVALTRQVNEAFDRDVEDFELSVSSAGLDLPFRNILQYQKYLNDSVNIVLATGEKHTDVSLLVADEEGIEIEYEKKEKLEGKKKPELVVKKERILYTDIKETRKTVYYK